MDNISTKDDFGVLLAKLLHEADCLKKAGHEKESETMLIAHRAINELCNIVDENKKHIKNIDEELSKMELLAKINQGK